MRRARPLPALAISLTTRYKVPRPFGYDEVAFGRDVIARWADICVALIDNKGLLHHQMGHIGRLCEAHPEVAPEVFQFLEALVAKNDAVSEIRNAVAVSFLDWQDVQRLGFSERLPANIAEIIKEQWMRYQRGTSPSRLQRCRQADKSKVEMQTLQARHKKSSQCRR